ncbi:hypothetical protein BC835DRAFT_1450766 [Cytidiella melzeri]|nr:hypothetical protein BC835DRAFT_1450766 [Cytidiella melzeri]
MLDASLSEPLSETLVGGLPRPNGFRSRERVVTLIEVVMRTKVTAATDAAITIHTSAVVTARDLRHWYRCGAITAVPDMLAVNPDWFIKTAVQSSANKGGHVSQARPKRTQVKIVLREWDKGRSRRRASSVGPTELMLVGILQVLTYAFGGSDKSLMSGPPEGRSSGEGEACMATAPYPHETANAPHSMPPRWTAPDATARFAPAPRHSHAICTVPLA